MYKIIISYIIASALALGLLNHAVNKAQDNIETLAEGASAPCGHLRGSQGRIAANDRRPNRAIPM